MKKRKQMCLSAILLAAVIFLTVPARAEAPAQALETATPETSDPQEDGLHIPETATPETATPETAAETPAPKAEAGPVTPKQALSPVMDSVPAPAAAPVERTLGDFRVLADPELVSYSDNTLRIKDGAQVTIRMAEGVARTTQSRIVVEKDASADITLDGVDIDLSAQDYAAAFRIEDSSTGDVHVTLAAGSTNRLTSGRFAAALQKNGDGSDVGALTIEGPGALTANGGYWAAGIGGSNNSPARNITILSGTVNAAGGWNGAGIGGGRWQGGNNITIRGGNVTAVAGGCAYGIGGGVSSASSGLSITGGTVTASSPRLESYQGYALLPDVNFGGYSFLAFGNRAQDAPSETVIGYWPRGGIPYMRDYLWVQIRPLTGFTLPLTADPGQAALDGYGPVSIDLQAMLYAQIDDPEEQVPLPSEVLTWSLSGALSPDTRIDEAAHRLIVGAGETAEALTVTVRNGDTVSTITIPVWQPFTVRFDSQGGSPVPQKTVAKDSALAPPAAPTRSGYRFTGWYTDAAAIRAWDFSMPVTADMVLYAGWAAAPSPEAGQTDDGENSGPAAAPVSGIPATGDARTTGTWLALFLLCSAGVVWCWRRRG